MAEGIAVCGRMAYGADSGEPLWRATWRVDPSSGSRMAEGLCCVPRMAVEGTILSVCTVRIAAARSAAVVEELSTVVRDEESRERTGARAGVSTDAGAGVSTDD